MKPLSTLASLPCGMCRQMVPVVEAAIAAQYPVVSRLEATVYVYRALEEARKF